MNPLDRLAHIAVAVAARRWPPELSSLMGHEWQAELDALRADGAVPPMTRRWQTVMFAASLLMSPAVEATGEPPAGWRERVHAVAGAAGVTLLAGALGNLIHLGYGQLRRGSFPATVVGHHWSGLVLVALAVLVMAAVVPPASRPLRWTVLLSVGLFAFFMAGNRIAVMPFMGWRDILPAVLSWAALSTLSAHAAGRLARRGRRDLAALTAAGGGLVTVDLATVAGSWHAATVLGVEGRSALAWPLLALMPGPAHVGPMSMVNTASVAAAPGSIALHGLDLLLANATAMVGPLLLCSVFVARLALRTGSRTRGLRLRAESTPSVQTRSRPVPAWRWLSQGDRQIVLGIAGALFGLAACELLRRTGDVAGAAPDPLQDHSAVFGFGFLAYTPARAAVALLVGFLATRIGATRIGPPVTSVGEDEPTGAPLRG